MSLALILLVLGLVSGLARGGRLSNIGRAQFRYPGLVFAGLSLQIAAELAAAFVNPAFRQENRGVAVLVASYALLGAFVVVNRHVRGAAAIGTGLVLNIAVIAANGGMPVSVRALVVAGIDPGDYLDRAVKHREMLPGTPLGLLGDVIPIPFLRAVVSLGDIVLALGIFRLVESLVRYDPRHRAPRTRPSPGGSDDSGAAGS
ncbi:MAG: DUF5317 domain-containing protein [Actinomycetota bacterium]